MRWIKLAYFLAALTFTAQSPAPAQTADGNPVAGRRIAVRLPFVIDTSPISIPGVAAHEGQLSIVGDCLGQPGAVRRHLGALDFPK
jgi:hypothetical protein